MNLGMNFMFHMILDKTSPWKQIGPDEQEVNVAGKQVKE
jgi:hypothetical protein